MHTSTTMSGQKRKETHGSDAFLSSMTFASGGVMRNCDCDECDFIPIPIAEAIRQHKRMRTHALTRTQDRSLVARAGTVSVWKLTMPVDAEPLIEFGNSHRIVLVDSLSSVRGRLVILHNAPPVRCRMAHNSCMSSVAIDPHVYWERRCWLE